MTCQGSQITKFRIVSIKGQELTSSPEVPVAADTGHQMVKIFQKEPSVNISEMLC